MGIVMESDEYRKNSDLNVNEEEFAFETDDDEDGYEDEDGVGDLDPIGLSLKDHGKNISLNADDDGVGQVRSPSGLMSDFDEKEIGYTNQLVQGSQNNHHQKSNSSSRFKLFGR